MPNGSDWSHPEMQRRLVQHALFRANGSHAGAAKLLGMSETDLRAAMRILFPLRKCVTPPVAPEPAGPRAANVVRGPWKSRE